MTPQPFPNLEVLVGAVVVENDVNNLANRNFGLDGIQEADELLMAMTLHAATDDSAFQHIKSGEQRGGAMDLVIVGHGGAAPPLQRQAGLAAIEGLNLRLLVEGQHDGVRRWIDIKPDDVTKLGGKLRIIGQLEAAHPMRLQAVAAPDALY